MRTNAGILAREKRGVKMEILDTRTDPPTVSYGICYPCALDDLVEAVMHGFTDAAKEGGFLHLFDHEVTADKTREFVKNQLQDRRCRAHYVEPLGQGDDPRDRDRMPFDYDYRRRDSE